MMNGTFSSSGGWYVPHTVHTRTRIIFFYLRSIPATLFLSFLQNLTLQASKVSVTFSRKQREPFLLQRECSSKESIDKIGGFSLCVLRFVLFVFMISNNKKKKIMDLLFYRSVVYRLRHLFFIYRKRHLSEELIDKFGTSKELILSRRVI